MPFYGEFDAAVVSLALHEMPPQVRENVWQSMQRAVRPQGHLIALDYAIPSSRGLWARMALGLVEGDERSFLSIHPQHYENFREFMASGGLDAWIQRRSELLETVYNFWGGVISVTVCQR